MCGSAIYYYPRVANPSLPTSTFGENECVFPCPLIGTWIDYENIPTSANFARAGFTVTNDMVFLKGLLRTTDYTSTIIMRLPPGIPIPDSRFILTTHSNSLTVRVDGKPDSEIIYVGARKFIHEIIYVEIF